MCLENLFCTVAARGAKHEAFTAIECCTGKQCLAYALTILCADTIEILSHRWRFPVIEIEQAAGAIV